MHYVKDLIPLVLFCGNVKGSNGSNHFAQPMNSKSQHVLTYTRYTVWWSCFTPPSYYSISQRTYSAIPGNFSVRPRSYAVPPDSYFRLPNSYSRLPYSYSEPPCSYFEPSTYYSDSSGPYGSYSSSYFVLPSSSTPFSGSVHPSNESLDASHDSGKHYCYSLFFLRLINFTDQWNYYSGIIGESILSITVIMKIWVRVTMI